MVSLDYFLVSPARTAMSGFVVGGAIGVVCALLSLYLKHAYPAGYYSFFS